MTATIEAGRTVSFRQMKDGTAEDFALLDALEDVYAEALPERILQHLERLQDGLSGYQISRLEHSLQTATLALRDGADVDWVVTALVHDIGDDLAPANHDSLAAAILKPYVREECTWVVQHHGIFQLVYYAHHMGKNPEARRKYADSPYYQAAVDFCERWDQAAFNPNGEILPLSTFASMVHQVFTREPWNPTHLRPGVRVPLASG